MMALFSCNASKYSRWWTTRSVFAFAARMRFAGVKCSNIGRLFNLASRFTAGVGHSPCLLRILHDLSNSIARHCSFSPSCAATTRARRDPVSIRLSVSAGACLKQVIKHRSVVRRFGAAFHTGAQIRHFVIAITRIPRWLPAARDLAHTPARAKTRQTMAVRTAQQQQELSHE
jgi:hypothetical protein